MSKKITLTAALLILVGLGAWYISQDSGNESEVSTNKSSETTPPNDKVNTGSRTGSYIEYSEEALTAAEGTKLLFFHAPWCPQCRALEADIQASGVPANVTIFKVDYDSNQKLRQRYGVTLQTTLVKVGNDGELIKKYVAYDSPTLEAVSDNLL